MSYTAPIRSDLTDRLRFAARTLMEHGSFLRVSLRSQGADEHDIDDLLQDLFLCLATDRAPREQISRRYLYKVVLNDFIDLKRTTHRREELLYRARTASDTKALTSSDRPMVTADEMDQLLSIIERRLPPCHAQAVVLRHVEGLDVGETAQRLGVSPRTVSHYISVGLRRVREFVRERKDEP
jgi:RNA polymerase sigma factor (sigma-70 family)